MWCLDRIYVNRVVISLSYYLSSCIYLLINSFNKANRMSITIYLKVTFTFLVTYIQQIGYILFIVQRFELNAYSALEILLLSLLSSYRQYSLEYLVR